MNDKNITLTTGKLNYYAN